MELKRYQKRVLDEVRSFLDQLTVQQAKGNAHASMDAWKAATGRAMPNGERFNGLGRELPNFCIKVPTGGGKTLLATQIVGQLYSTIMRDRNGMSGGRGAAIATAPIVQARTTSRRVIIRRSASSRRYPSIPSAIA